jgi:hypothetical protein
LLLGQAEITLFYLLHLLAQQLEILLQMVVVEALEQMLFIHLLMSVNLAVVEEVVAVMVALV